MEDEFHHIEYAKYTDSKQGLSAAQVRSNGGGTTRRRISSSSSGSSRWWTPARLEVLQDLMGSRHMNRLSGGYLTRVSRSTTERAVKTS